MDRRTRLSIEDESLELVVGGADSGIAELGRGVVSKGISAGVVATNIGVSLAVVASHEASSIGQALLAGLDTSAR
ncbi:MAG: hypothetical protein JWN48_4781 [Myxococcaceae bacterium]|nr:hypothetical protein [Myxococcaceae bacterium]